MSNGARHAWGILVGLVLTAALTGLLLYGTYRLQHGYLAQLNKDEKWIGGGLLVGAAVVFALMTASRLSPISSLIGGLALTTAGALFFISETTTADLINRAPRDLRLPLIGLERGGFLVIIGVGLLIASFFPSRWRSQYEDEEDYEYDTSHPTAPYTQPTNAGRHSTARTLYEAPHTPQQPPYPSGQPPHPEGGTR